MSDGTGGMIRFPKSAESVATQEEEPRFWILVRGNPVSGFRYFGPFGDIVAAMGFADAHIIDGDCWTAELEDTRSLVRQD